MNPKPIFIAGKEVPHRNPAKIVKNNAFFLLFKKSPNVFICFNQNIGFLSKQINFCSEKRKLDYDFRFALLDFCLLHTLHNLFWSHIHIVIENIPRSKEGISSHISRDECFWRNLYR